MQKTGIHLPRTIIDTHCHGRDLEQSHKTTIRQTLLEAINSHISISVLMPNPLPPITSIGVLKRLISAIKDARRNLGIKKRQYIYFGITDDNLEECDHALEFQEVVGLKDYPLGEDGKTVTTGTIGVSRRETRLAGLSLVKKYDKVYARHNDNPEIIAREGHTINAETTDVEDTISLESEVPGAKIVACHVSCRESAELILKAQHKGSQIAIELCPHYLWFDANGTNWNPELDPVFYKCFNNLRTGEHREFLISLLLSNNPLILIGSDNAPHTTEEKIHKKLGGLPSNQEMVAVICTLAKKYGISDQRVAELISWNAGKFLGIEFSHKFHPCSLEERIDALTYNHGIVTNPWNGSKLLFPTRL